MLGNIQTNKETIEVIRDDYGVPHVYAENVEGLYCGYGYVMAQDRLFQLEMFRRGNAGTVSELLGEQYLERDQLMRRDGYSDNDIIVMIQKMDEFSIRVLDNFTKGINKFISEANEHPDTKLSKEFHDLQMQPDTWNDIDVIRLFLSSQMVFMDQEQEIINGGILSALVSKYGEEIGLRMFNDIFWINDSTSPPTSEQKIFKNGNGKAPKTLNKLQLPKGIDKVADGILARRKRFEKRSKEIMNPLSIGSYAVVVGSGKSASNHPLLLGGPQAGFTAPGFLYEVGLHGPDIDITGSSFIGYPFIMFGTTNEIAFTSTAGYGNMVDIFIEETDPDNSLKYKHHDEWLDMEERKETFHIKEVNGNVKKIEKLFYKTIHGPVIYFDNENNIAYSKAWTFRGTEVETWTSNLKTNWSKNEEEFMSTAQLGTLSLNRFCADKHGTISYYHAGRYPDRDKRIDVRLPTPGTGEYDWKGYMDMKDNPYERNPKKEYFVNWNNKPAPNWHNGELCSNWGRDHRVQQYIDALETDNELSLKKLDELNYSASLVQLRTKAFKPILLDYLKKHERDKKLIDCLFTWNNLTEDLDQDGYYDSPALTIFETWYENLYNLVFQDLLTEVHPALEQVVNHNYGNGLLLKILEDDNSLEYKWLESNEVQNVIGKAFDKAIYQLKIKFETPDFKKWLTPVQMMSFGGSSIIGIQHGYGAEEKIQKMNRGSENHYVEMTPEGFNGFNITPPGHVGFIDKDGNQDAHYKDQIEMYEKWEYKPMYLDKQKILNNAIDIQHIKL